MRIKTLIEVVTEFSAEETSEFKALSKAAQAEALSQNHELIRELIVSEFPPNTEVVVSFELDAK